MGRFINLLLYVAQMCLCSPLTSKDTLISPEKGFFIPAGTSCNLRTNQTVSILSLTGNLKREAQTCHREPAPGTIRSSVSVYYLSTIRTLPRREPLKVEMFFVAVESQFYLLLSSASSQTFV